MAKGTEVVFTKVWLSSVKLRLRFGERRGCCGQCQQTLREGATVFLAEANRRQFKVGTYLYMFCSAECRKQGYMEMLVKAQQRRRME